MTFPSHTQTRARRSGLPAMLLALLFLLGGVQAIAQEEQRPSPEELLEEQLALQRQSGIWIQPGGNFAAVRYSDLTEITNENVAQLEVQWTMSTGVLRGHEGQPLIVNDMMYFTTPFPNILYAIDLNNRSEEHTSELQSRGHLVCRLLLEKKNIE